MAIKKINQFLVNLFGSRNERVIKTYMQIAQQAGSYEQQTNILSDADLKAQTAKFKDSLANGGDPDKILPEVFAVMREASDRHLGIRNTFVDEFGFDSSLLDEKTKAIYEDLKSQVDGGVSIYDLDVPVEYNHKIRELFPLSKPPFRFRHFDVQVIGGHVLHEGKIAEMATGEGKTLVATLAAYLVYLTGKGVHVVTVNDYLASRDAKWVEPAFKALGITVGAIQSEQNPNGPDRRAQYQCDITYGTNNEFGFDYLRDNMKVSIEQMAQGELEFAIIDEVDSILIDEARTPLIISGPAFDDVTKYKKADVVVKQILNLQSSYDKVKHVIDNAEKEVANAKGELAEARQSKDKDRVEKAQAFINDQKDKLEKAEIQLEGITEYYTIELERKAVSLTESGEIAAQEIAGVGSFYTGSNSQWPHLIEQSLRAHVCFVKEKDYVVMDGKVVIVDEFTGRLMQGRQWSDGLHQAVEAKENVTVKEESQTLATITLQNFFKLYGQIAGMTGTAATEAGEFMQIYELDTVIMPTNRPCIREDCNDKIYKSMREKFKAIVEEIHEVSSSGRPVLVGTVSVEKSEGISAALTKHFGVEHELLNAKQHAREAVIVAKAGHQHKDRKGNACGNVTIATNMAGRGTDIKISDEVQTMGGLHVLGTERHEARRIDNQLRGRAGRQGDDGSSIFFLSFDDDLLKMFMPGGVVKALTRVGWEEGLPIEHRMISKNIEKAQRKVENRNFEQRKSLLDYDEVMDYQRKYFYTHRKDILKGKELKPLILEMVEAVIERAYSIILAEDYAENCIIDWARNNFSIDLKPRDIRDININEIEMIAKDKAIKNTSSTISLSIGEYLQDYDDSSTWDINGLCKWAMSSFQADLSASKVKHMTPEEIEASVIEAATRQVKKKECPELVEIMREDYALKTFSEWAKNKFEVSFTLDEIRDLKPIEVKEKLSSEILEKYTNREIQYPVEFAMNMAYGQAEQNVYAFDALSQWVKDRFDEDITPEEMKDSKPSKINERLLELSKQYHDSQMEALIDSKLLELSGEELLAWANGKFRAELADEDLNKENLMAAGFAFLRTELTELERYVLVQIYDSCWKDHLYAMDHLKESIFLRAFAEKDPKIEYRQEGFRMFKEMQQVIEQRVTDIIFKVRLQAGEKARSVWNVSNVQHDQVNQFAMAEKQRAAATAPQQGEKAVKQIKLDQPKVGRNDPCPCGSGKKYKKCCGAN